ncbi:MAG: glycosyltransferase family 2 protein [Kiritimatiellae bacterium]|nr:glycosyltransferase family 2 protein [Kiritimatiellia bacterium]MCO5062213.1 glycosyltransferase family 2 protein [Kiritimatiellia bacterium]MCO5069019.1 glycosyltransferase family 2 protein [Kiritimatiellia bacterium]
MISDTSTSSIRLGIAIPTMNRPDMLRMALRSALAQRRPADVIYILDNSSKPDTDLLSEFVGAPIRYRHEATRFPVEEAFTRVLRETEADYVCLLEDDNLFGPDHLAAMEEAIRLHPNAGVYSSAAFVFSDDCGAISRNIFAPCWPHPVLDTTPIFIEPGLALATSIFGTPLCASATAINSAVLKNTQLVPSLCRSPHDCWRWAQLSAKNGLVFVPQITAWFRVHGSNISHDIRGKQHRAENWKVTQLVLDLMEQNDLDPEEWTKRLSAILSPERRRFLATVFLRHRKLSAARRFLPPLLQRSSLWACAPEVASISFNMLLTRLGR